MATNEAQTNEMNETNGAAAARPIVVYTKQHDAAKAMKAALGDPTRVTIADADGVVSRVQKVAAIDEDFLVTIAGIGAFTAGEVTAETRLPEAGDAGYTLSFIGQRKVLDDEGRERDAFSGIAIYPAHSVNAIVDYGSTGEAWLQDKADKELGLVAFRGLRFDLSEDDFSTAHAAALEMPCGLTDFLERSRGSGGSPYAVFLDNITDFKKFLRAKKVFGGATDKIIGGLPPKREMLQAVRSSSYAAAHYPYHENAEGGSLFVRIAVALAGMIEKSQAAGPDADGNEPILGDPQVIRRWIEERDSVDFGPQEIDTGDLGGVDLSAFI